LRTCSELKRSDAQLLKSNPRLRFGAPPESGAAPQLIEESFDQILATAAAISDPFGQAFFVMVQLPYLQPFDDVNKRVSRLAANIPLIKRNLTPLSFTDVPRQTYTEAVLGAYELKKKRPSEGRFHLGL
jgi:Fic family protein